MTASPARIVRDPINPATVIARVEGHDAGAILTFAGTVRDTHHERAVNSIDYHAYESMAEKEIVKLENEAAERWPGVRLAIVHRIGHLGLGETSVLLAVASPHRPAGFAARRVGIDELKKRVPIWKREMYQDGGEAWLEGS